MYVNRDIDYMKWLADKKLVIFGAGNLGKEACRKFKRLGFYVGGFVDNSKEKQGTYIEGMPVFSLDEAEKLEEEHIVYIVPDYEFRDEIKVQLLECARRPYISMEQIDFCYNNVSYYDNEYWEYQKKIGEKACKVDVLNFLPYLDKNDIVVEFGSGGGFLLSLIDAKEKVGIEINPYAIKNSQELGIKTVYDSNDLKDEYADKIISTHALEHVDNPLEILKCLRQKLKPDGLIVFVVPFQSDIYEYRRDDIDNEFWNWNCRTLGNLFKRAGFFILRVEVIDNQYPSNFASILEETGIESLVCIDQLYSQYSESKSIRIIAKK